MKMFLSCDCIQHSAYNISDFYNGQVVVSNDKGFYIWSIREKEFKCVAEVKDYGIEDMKYLVSHNFLIIVADKSKALIWSVTQKKCIGRLENVTEMIDKIAYSEVTQKIAIVCNEILSIYNFNGFQLEKIYTECNLEVFDIQFDQCHLVKLVSTNFVAVLTLGTAILVVSKT